MYEALGLEEKDSGNLRCSTQLKTTHTDAFNAINSSMRAEGCVKSVRNALRARASTTVPNASFKRNIYQSTPRILSSPYIRIRIVPGMSIGSDSLGTEPDSYNRLPEGFIEIKVHRVLFPIQKSILEKYSCFQSSELANTIRALSSMPVWIWLELWTWLQKANTTPTNLDIPTLDKAPKIELLERYPKSTHPAPVRKAEPVLRNAVTLYSVTKQLKLNALNSTQAQLLRDHEKTYEDPIAILSRIYEDDSEQLRQWAKVFMAVPGNAKKMLEVKEWKADLVTLFKKDGRAAMDFVEALVEARGKESKEPWWPKAPAGAAWTHGRVSETYQEAKVIGVILPLSQGRGPDWISIDEWSSIRRLRVHFQDITKYALGRVPDEQHQNFIWTNDMNLGSYDLVICNGQLLYNMSAPDPRTADSHSRIVLRSRLIFSQLILALHYVNQGGALLLNLGDVNGRFAIKLICVFAVFAKLRLFKLQRGDYSALYLIATDIDTGHPLATEVLDDLKVCWSAATFENVPATVTDTDFSTFMSLSNELMKTMDHLSEITSLLTEEDFDAFMAVFSS
ncbi:MAG: hypothetical protein M1835_005613 [Candelina submexicana]|nr:MAG: hypothetical protein M1835_005613 [Candelina submexicana]